MEHDQAGREGMCGLVRRKGKWSEVWVTRKSEEWICEEVHWSPRAALD